METNANAEQMRVLLDAAIAHRKGEITTKQYETIAERMGATDTLGRDELARDAARYRKLRPRLAVATLSEAIHGLGPEVHRQLTFNGMILDYWGPASNAQTVDELIDLAPDSPT